MTAGTVYDEDEAPPPAPVPVQASRSGVLVYNTYCEYPAVANGADHEGFAVMVHLKVPARVTAAPLDLVAVLDVSESMAGAKLAQLKRAMAFAINRLGSRDRLSVVAFSRQVTPLTRMTDDAKAVDALEASSPASTNVRAGLDEAAKLLRGTNRPFHVASVILVSADGGHDSCVVVPEFFLRDSDWTMPGTPVHTFGLGSDVDAAAMYNVSEAMGVTFSFVEDHAAIQDALARCIGGLRSVTAHDVYLEINRADDPDDCDYLNISAVKSGRYKTSSIARSSETVDVHVGDLYADEERRFLLLLDIPRLDEDYISTRLINLNCSYMDLSSRQEVLLEDGQIYEEIERPVEATDVARCRCVEVERELLCVAAAEDMALAREAAERGAYDEAARILDARRESLSRSASALAGNAMCTAVADEREYKKTGRACILACISSHSLQRGSSSSVQFGCGVGSSVFATPAMRRMGELSEMTRKQQDEALLCPPLLPKNGSKTIGSRRLEARLALAVPRLSMLSKYRPSSTQAINKSLYCTHSLIKRAFFY